MLKQTEEPSALATYEGGSPERAEAKESVSRKRHGWRCIRPLAVILAILTCVWLCRASVLRSIAGLLIAGQEPLDPDYVWIRTEDGLICEGDGCYDQAASLYHQDTSRRIILTRPYPNRLVQAGVVPCFETISRRELAARGVPREAVVLIDGASENPWQEARRLGTWMRERPDADVLLLCDRFGSRRWRYILNTVLGADHVGAVRTLALPDRRYNETNWWKSRCGVKSLFNQYVALAYAWCQRENVPGPDPWDPDDYERIVKQTVGEGL